MHVGISNKLIPGIRWFVRVWVQNFGADGNSQTVFFQFQAQAEAINDVLCYGQNSEIGEKTLFRKLKNMEFRRNRKKIIISPVCPNLLNYRTLCRRNSPWQPLNQRKMKNLKFFSCINLAIVVLSMEIDCSGFVHVI